MKELQVVVSSLQQSLQANQLKHSKITASLASLSCGPEEGQSEQRSPVGRHSATGDTSARDCMHVTIMGIIMVIYKHTMQHGFSVSYNRMMFPHSMDPFCIPDCANSRATS